MLFHTRATKAQRTGEPPGKGLRVVGRSRTIDAAKHDTAQMLGGSAAADTVDPIGKPSGESHERQDNSTTQKRDLGPPHIHTPEGGARFDHRETMVDKGHVLRTHGRR